jgi:hypothetical protein
LNECSAIDLNVSRLSSKLTYTKLSLPKNFIKCTEQTGIRNLSGAKILRGAHLKKSICSFAKTPILLRYFYYGYWSILLTSISAWPCKVIF